MASPSTYGSTGGTPAPETRPVARGGISTASRESNIPRKQIKEAVARSASRRISGIGTRFGPGPTHQGENAGSLVKAR